MACLTAALGRVVSSSSPVKLVFDLQPFAVPTGTPNDEYLTALQGLVQYTQCEELGSGDAVGW